MSHSPNARRPASGFRGTRLGELARRLHAETGVGYQKALGAVTAASAAGRLPERLDDDGVDLALRHLLEQETAVWAPALLGSSWPVYYRPLLASLPGQRTERGRLALARATAAPRPGGLCLTESGYYSTEYLELELGARRFNVSRMALGTERDVLSWLLTRFDTIGDRLHYELGGPYPGRADLPVDEAVDITENGRLGSAEENLLNTIARQPWDIDAYAHLGLLALMRHDQAHDPAVPPPSAAQKRAWLQDALGWFEAGVAVGEAQLPNAFTGLLPKDDGPNSWFYRAVGGLAHTLWRLGRYNGAEQALIALLYLNPLDDYGARDILPLVRTCSPWRYVKSPY
jgi:hypothetical protein